MKERINEWKSEERIAHIHGWDFSHIAGRYTEEDDLPWDYREVIGRHLTPETRLLDIDTGGGEFLLSLGHPHGNTAATENYPPNVELCREVLLPLGRHRAHQRVRRCEGSAVCESVTLLSDK